MRRGRLIVVVGTVLAAAGWLGFWAFGEWRYRSELRQAAEDFAGRRYSEAGDRLALMALRWPGRAEVEYWLGTCKLKEGDREAALDAWGRVPDDSPEAPAVAMARAGVAIELFRYGLAEACLKRAIRAGAKRVTKLGGCWAEFTGSRAGVTNTGGSCRRTPSERAILPTCCALSGAWITTRIRSTP